MLIQYYIEMQCVSETACKIIWLPSTVRVQKFEVCEYIAAMSIKIEK